MLKINLTKYESKKIIEENDEVILNFYATWCGPCKMFGPVIEEVTNEDKNIIFIKIDIDLNNDYASELNINSVPTTIKFKNNSIVKKENGFMSKEKLNNFIKN